MTLIELMRQLQGEQSQEAFAERLGVHQTMVSAVYRGDRRPGRRVVAGLLRAFPERADEIKGLFFASE